MTMTSKSSFSRHNVFVLSLILIAHGRYGQAFQAPSVATPLQTSFYKPSPLFSKHVTSTPSTFELQASSILSDPYSEQSYRAREWASQVSTLTRSTTAQVQSTTSAWTRTWASRLANLPSTIKSYSWALPLSLCLVPPICEFVLERSATTPSWWKMVNMEYIAQSSNAAVVIFLFLFSNIAYFWSGAYLLQKFPVEKLSTPQQQEQSQSSSLLKAVRPRLPALATSRFSWLGVWMLLAGVVSTVFHSVQALGSSQVAESLCYVDHGIAISAGAYFMHVCGLPSQRRTWVLGVIGLAALALPLQPGYAWLHSAWHLLSSAAAVMWAVQGKATRQAQLELALAKRQAMRS
jgi:hypothetical protein